MFVFRRQRWPSGHHLAGAGTLKRCSCKSGKATGCQQPKAVEQNRRPRSELQGPTLRLSTNKPALAMALVTLGSSCKSNDMRVTRNQLNNLTRAKSPSNSLSHFFAEPMRILRWQPHMWPAHPALTLLHCDPPLVAQEEEGVISIL